MKWSFIALLMVLASLAVGQEAMPRMTTVEPGNGKVGDELVVTGENLAKPGVAKLYLTDGKNDTEVTVTEQAATTIKFKIPPRPNRGGSA